MKYSLLTLDLDGTLLNADKRVSPRTRSTLLQAMDQGVRVALISGRPLVSMLEAARALELSQRGGFLSAFNSGLVVDCESDTVLCERRVPRQAALQLCSAAEKAGLAVLGYDERSVFSTDTQAPYVIEEAENNRLPLRAVASLADCPTSVLYVAVGDEEKIAAFYHTWCSACPPGIVLELGAPWFLSIQAPAVSKADGARIIMERLGLCFPQVMSCGDGLNDLPLLKLAGLGVAMGNGCPQVKAAARVTTASNLEDGVAQAVERYLLSPV